MPVPPARRDRTVTGQPPSPHARLYAATRQAVEATLRRWDALAEIDRCFEDLLPPEPEWESDLSDRLVDHLAQSTEEPHNLTDDEIRSAFELFTRTHWNSP